ncbi:MAG TPA: hypothetical protein DGG94_21175 [Micromonosporaceae bacterium]|nr:hypothetical protein [Micromonosporaceae bacterium]HCU52274.1 hypothetical protein [Micromonosporaceae bacterium]
MTLTLEAARRVWDSLPLPIDDGLAEVELRRVEKTFGFAFNPDHRVLLAAGMPLGGRWPDWRHVNSHALRERLAEPIEGVLFDVAENGFWYPQWGKRPAKTDDAVALARRALDGVPKLVPVYGHRYAPALPESGLPVLSVVQTDVAVYGQDLPDYLSREFGEPGAEDIGSVKAVPFWGDLT